MWEGIICPSEEKKAINSLRAVVAKRERETNPNGKHFNEKKMVIKRWV